MRDVKRGALAAAVGAVVVALAGCGAVDSIRYPYAKEDGEKILADAVRATSEVTSVRISGYVDARGEPRTHFNVLTAENGNCGGTMTFSTADFDIVITPKAVYLKGSAASWQQHPDLTREQGIVVGPVLADEWVELDPVKGTNPHDFCSLLDEFTDPDEESGSGKGSDEDAGEEEVDNLGLTDATGMKTVKLEVSDDKRSTDAWVAVEEPHYLVKVAREEGDRTGEFVFSDFDFKGEVRVPDKKDVIVLSELTAKDFDRPTG